MDVDEIGTDFLFFFKQAIPAMKKGMAGNR